MATITFDPHNPADLELIARLLGTSAAHVTSPAQSWTPGKETNWTESTAPTQPEASTESDNLPELDVHGMAWDDAIHSTPPAINSDGSWRARRGKKDEYEAAIAAHKAAQATQGGTALAKTATPAPATVADGPVPDGLHATLLGMPTPQPATMPAAPVAPAPTTPPAPIGYATMEKRFIAMMNDKRFGNFEQVYADLSVSYDDMEVNQTSIARLWHYMDGIDEGMGHAGAVRHALGSV